MKIKAENIAADKGYDAAESGEARESNPYSVEYFLHEWWDLGWLEFEG